LILAHRRGDERDAAEEPIELRYWQSGLAHLGLRHDQLRPVTALAAFHLDKFCDLLTE